MNNGTNNKRVPIQKTLTEKVPEAPKIPEVPKRRRILMVTAILAIAIVVVSAGIGLYVLRAPDGEEPSPTASPTPSPTPIEYETYSKYGFSFEHPKGMSIEELHATEDSGGVAGFLYLEDKAEIVEVVWVTVPSPLEQSNLKIIMDAGFESMKSKGIPVEKGNLVNSDKSGHEMLCQYFTATREGETMSGAYGVWYCNTSKRYYELILFCFGQEMLAKYQNYLDSFVCH